jgi:hypothetical protein
MPWLLAPLLLEGLPVLLGAIVLLALAETAKVWLEPTVAGLTHRRGSFIGRIADLVTVPLRAAAAAIFAGVSHSISVAASHRMRPLARWISGAGSWLLAVVFGFALLARDTAYGFERLTTVVLPRQIGRATRPINRRALAALGLAGALAAQLARYRRGIDRLIRTKVMPQIRHATHAVDVAIPRALGRIRTRVGRLEDRVSNPSRAWLRRIARSLWAAGLAGLFIRALARRFPWLFCRKVKGVGQRVCGLDAGLLDSLLLDTLVLSGTISVVQMARELQAIEGAAVNLVRGFVDELP